MYVIMCIKFNVLYILGLYCIMGVDRGGVRGMHPLRRKRGDGLYNHPLPYKGDEQMKSIIQYSTILKSILQKRLYHT